MQSKQDREIDSSDVRSCRIRRRSSACLVRTAWVSGRHERPKKHAADTHRQRRTGNYLPISASSVSSAA